MGRGDRVVRALAGCVGMVCVRMASLNPRGNDTN